MRPLGHTGMREGRETRSTSIDALQDAWMEYIRAYPRLHSEIREEECLAHARELLAPLRPTKYGLDHLILHVSSSTHENGVCTHSSSYERGWFLGLFVTGGLSLLPEKRITHDLTTPDVHNFGYGLKKDIIVNGALGRYAGKRLEGRLVNRGTISNHSGEEMDGTFINHGIVHNDGGRHMRGLLVNNGQMGFSVGENMIGSIVNYGAMRQHAARWMIGTFINRGTLGPDPAIHMTGSFVNLGTYASMEKQFFFGRIIDGGKTEWVYFRGYAPFFFYDITNPENLSTHDLREELGDMYGASR